MFDSNYDLIRYKVLWFFNRRFSKTWFLANLVHCESSMWDINAIVSN